MQSKSCVRYSFLLTAATCLVLSACSTTPPLRVPFPTPPASLMQPLSPLQPLPTPTPATPKSASSPTRP